MLSGLGDHGKIQSKHRFCPRKSITLHNVCAIHRGMFSTLGGYHEYTRGCSVQWGFHTNSIVVPITSPYIIMISLGVLNTPQCTQISPGILNIPHCTAHPPVYCTDIMQGVNFVQLETNRMRKKSFSNTPFRK